MLDDRITQLRSIHPDSYVYLAGDLNARTGELLDFIPGDSLDFVFNTSVEYYADQFELPRSSCDKENVNSFGRALIDLCCTHNIHIVNGRASDNAVGHYTCIANNGSSLVDYHVVSSELFPFIDSFYIDEKDDSDHFPAVCFSNFKLKAIVPKKPEIKNSVNLHSYDHFIWRENHKDSFVTDFAAKIRDAYEKILSSLDDNLINEVVSILIDLYKSSAVDMHLDLKHKADRRNMHPDWWDSKCDELKKLKFSLLRRYRTSNNNLDLVNYKKSRNEFKLICREKKYLFLAQKRKTLVEASNNPQAFWSILKKSRNELAECYPCKITSRQWLSYFDSLLCVQNKNSISSVKDNRKYFKEQMDQVLNTKITLSEVQAGIHKLKTGKAHGKDGIPAEFYKSTLDIISPILVVLFNKIFDSGIFPETWSDTLILPIYKSGSRNDPNNYRGITLLNIMYKIFSNIINERLITWTQTFHILDEAQAGFRKGYSAIDNIFTLQSMVQKYLTKPRVDSMYYI